MPDELKIDGACPKYTEQLLHSLCGIEKLAFKALIPILIEWRDAVDMKCK